MFARHGIPDELVSDNGPQFASAEFRDFATKWEFTHSTSSPGYPQSNGQAERTVQTVKHLLQKAAESGRDPYLALLEYRNAPLEGVGHSPAQLLMSRRLKTKLPASATLLKPVAQDTTDIQQRIKDRQNVQKFYYDRHTRPMAPVEPGEAVRVRRDGRWEPAIIQQQPAGAPRSHNIRVPGNRALRRTRWHLRRTREHNLLGPDGLEPDTVEVDQDTEYPALPVPQPEPDIAPVPPVSPVQTTRSGRAIHRPARFRD
jgi:transposase InsO family protein